MTLTTRNMMRTPLWLAPLLLAACSLQGAAVPAPLAAPPTSRTANVIDRAAFEADRRAILAMAGEYQVTFQFDEPMPLAPGYTPHAPHRSSGFEFIEVLEDSGSRIVLQHVLVIDDQVVKHWRQDWAYQRTRLWAYAGDNTWVRRELTAAEAAGTWTQAVWQVDDSPRYAGIGRWDHAAGTASWTSESEWRPLPRRELTTRNDYDKLIGVNRQTITPTGWVHEQDNLKIRRRADGGEQALVRERGHNVYTRVSGHDFGPGRAYWQSTRDYWAVVRDAWDARLAGHARLVILPAIDDERLYQTLFEQAEAMGGHGLATPDLRRAVDGVLDRFTRPAEVASSQQ